MPRHAHLAVGVFRWDNSVCNDRAFMNTVRLSWTIKRKRTVMQVLNSDTI